MKIEKTLKNLGFNDNKIKVYIALLELKEASAQEIARKAQIERTSVYFLLDSLENDGLVGKTSVKKRIHYIAQDPKALEEIMEKKLKQIKKSLPFLYTLFESSPRRPKIIFYNKKEGIKKILQGTLDSETKVLRNLSSAKDVTSLLGENFLTRHIEKRVAKGISVKSLRPRDKEIDSWYFQAKRKEALRESRFLPQGLSFNIVAIIYDNKVAVITSDKECFGFTIESEDFSNLMKMMYDFIWEKSEPVYKK